MPFTDARRAPLDRLVAIQSWQRSRVIRVGGRQPLRGAAGPAPRMTRAVNMWGGHARASRAHYVPCDNSRRVGRRRTPIQLELALAPALTRCLSAARSTTTTQS